MWSQRFFPSETSVRLRRVHRCCLCLPEVVRIQLGSFSCSRMRVKAHRRESFPSLRREVPRRRSTGGRESVDGTSHFIQIDNEKPLGFIWTVVFPGIWWLQRLIQMDPLSILLDFLTRRKLFSKQTSSNSWETQNFEEHRRYKTRVVGGSEGNREFFRDTFLINVNGWDLKIQKQSLFLLGVLKGTSEMCYCPRSPSLKKWTKRSSLSTTE